MKKEKLTVNNNFEKQLSSINAHNFIRFKYTYGVITKIHKKNFGLQILLKKIYIVF
jgi:hypothetical protein